MENKPLSLTCPYCKTSNIRYGNHLCHACTATIFYAPTRSRTLRFFFTTALLMGGMVYALHLYLFQLPSYIPLVLALITATPTTFIFYFLEKKRLQKKPLFSI